MTYIRTKIEMEGLDLENLTYFGFEVPSLAPKYEMGITEIIDPIS